MSKSIHPGLEYYPRDPENDHDQGREAVAAAHLQGQASRSCSSKLRQLTEELREPVRYIPYQFRVLFFAAILAVLAGSLIGLPLYGSLAASQFGATSAATAVNMPQELSSQLHDLVTGREGEMTLLQHPTRESFVWLKVTVQDFDILGLKAHLDMEVIAAGNYSNPRQPAAFLLPNNTQLVLQTANIVQTYTTGDVPGAFAVTVPLAVQRPLLFYPFDAYSADLVISIALEQTMQCTDNSTAPCSPIPRNSSWALPLPLIAGVRNNVETMHVPLQLISFRELMSGLGAAAEPQPGPVTIYLQAQGQHTLFVCGYVVVLTVICVAIGLYLMVLALDQAFFRPRPIVAATLNTFMGALFAIPRVRNMLPGNVPVGMMIDIFGFGWALIMTGCGLLLMISLCVGQYKHKAKLFEFEKKTN